MKLGSPMLPHQQTLFVGAPRNAACLRTIQVVTGKLKSLGRFRGERLLDVGCGDGAFTFVLGKDFCEIYGIDVQEPFLARFREAAQRDRRFMI